MIETLDANLFHLATLPCSSLMQSSMQRRVNDFFSLSTCSMSAIRSIALRLASRRPGVCYTFPCRLCLSSETFCARPPHPRYHLTENSTTVISLWFSSLVDLQITQRDIAIRAVIMSGSSLPQVGVIVAQCRGYRCPNFVSTFFRRWKFNRLRAGRAKYYWLRRSIRSIALRLASRRPGVCYTFPCRLCLCSETFCARPPHPKHGQSNLYTSAEIIDCTLHAFSR